MPSRSCSAAVPRSASSVLLGVVVALWHLPLVAVGQLAPIGLVVTFAITLVYTWLFNHTGGSVLLTMVFHVAQGAVSSPRSASWRRRLPNGLAYRDAVVPDRRRCPGVADRKAWRSPAVRMPCAVTSRPGLVERLESGIGSSSFRVARHSRTIQGCPNDCLGGVMTSEEVSGPAQSRQQPGGAAVRGPERHLAFWIVMWILAVAGAEIGALAPFVFGPEARSSRSRFVFRLVGGSFAACGLIAWRRRPDSYSGRWMTATGFALLCRTFARPAGFTGRA